MADPLETRPSTLYVTTPNVVIFGQTVQAYYGDPPDKFDDSRFSR